MEREHEELVEDEHSKAGHLDLIFRQGKELGLSVDDVLNAQPLPTTKAAIYAWFCIARNRQWQEAISASIIAAPTNVDPLLVDIVGGKFSLPTFTRDIYLAFAETPLTPASAYTTPVV